MAKTRSYRRIRKRTLVVAGLTLAAALLVSGIIAVLAVLQVGPEELLILNVSEGSSRSAILGSGISLERAESANALRDSSFEPFVFRQTLTVYSGDSTTLTVSSEDASGGLYGDSFFNGAKARVLTHGPDGLVLKKTANVLRYGINRVGVFQPVKLPDDSPSETAVLALTRKNDISLAVGRQGLIVYNSSGQTPEIIESGVEVDLTGVCANDQGFLTCSAAGDILQSSNGRDWSVLATFPGIVFNSIASEPDGLFVAVGDQGALISGKDTRVSRLPAITDANLCDVVYGSAGFVAVGDSGAIISSRHGLIWLQRNLDNDANWRVIDHRDGRYIAAGQQGKAAFSDDGERFFWLRPDHAHDYQDVVMLSNKQLIFLNTEGEFTVSNDGGKTWLDSAIQTGMQSRVISLAGKDKILSADDQGRLGIAQLVAEITLDSALKEGQYQAGDLLFLEKTALSVPAEYLGKTSNQTGFAGPWEHFGAGTISRVADTSSPGGGEASLLIAADSNRPNSTAIASQILKLPDSAIGQRNEIYRLELWMKQSGIADRSVQVWLTAPFRQVGTTFNNVGTTWEKYSHTLIVPADMVGSTETQLRFNIAAVGGNLWIDQVSLCPITETPEMLADSLRTKVLDIAPQFIRLGFMPIGSPIGRTASWAYTLGNETSYLTEKGRQSHAAGSLYAALQLVFDSGSDPWLVVDSYTSQTELLNLIEYLAGPISEPFGKLRMEQGSVIPWVDRFGRILIEITDRSGVLTSDQLRVDFVDLMIDTITQSPYYRQVKGQLIFIDGMTYQAGMVLSSADFHATDLDGMVRADRAMGIREVMINYYDRIPRNPEKQIENWPELMRSAQLQPNGIWLPVLAELSTVLLADLGVQTTLSNLTYPAASGLENRQPWQVAAQISAAAARGVPLEIRGGTTEVLAYGFMSDRQLSLVLINLSDNSANCRLMTDLPFIGANLSRYDSKGQLVNMQTLKSLGSKHVIPPGGVICLVKNLSDN